MAIDRRTLIRRGCMAASAAVLPSWTAGGLFRSPGSSRKAGSADTILVVIQLAGGNDGLNTVIPIADPAYLAARPRIGLTPEQTLSVDAATGLHPSLANLHGYLGEGKLAIVQGVGYPLPDLSHFRSTDVWESGVAERVELSGWLGRTLDSLYSADAAALHSISWGTDSPNAFRGLNGIRSVITPAVFDPDHFRFETDGQDDDAKQRSIRAMLAPVGASEHDFIANVGAIGLADSAAILAARDSYTSTVTYPDNGLASWLRLTAAAISADIGPRIYWINQGADYDTHATQRGRHDSYLADLDAAVDAFYRDLVAHGQDQRVVLVTWSEFGRRVEDNDSGGTDHGTSAPLFVLGSRVRGGLFGEPPSLTDLDPDGNMKYAVDFRSVYSSILAKWIDADPVPILYGTYPTLDFL
jgi:uncharacterized protein (DUF1501 family)